jgi:hypothetical protein
MCTPAKIKIKKKEAQGNFKDPTKKLRQPACLHVQKKKSKKNRPLVISQGPNTVDGSPRVRRMRKKKASQA